MTIASHLCANLLSRMTGPAEALLGLEDGVGAMMGNHGDRRVVVAQHGQEGLGPPLGVAPQERQRVAHIRLVLMLLTALVVSIIAEPRVVVGAVGQNVIETFQSRPGSVASASGGGPCTPDHGPSECDGATTCKFVVIALGQRDPGSGQQRVGAVLAQMAVDRTGHTTNPRQRVGVMNELLPRLFIGRERGVSRSACTRQGAVRRWGLQAVLRCDER